MTPSSNSVLESGQVIGGYTILNKIATGGMGIVYRARKEVLDRIVALKVLNPELVTRQQHLDRFLREAKIAASLDHPAIVKVFDVGEDLGLYFIAMEYVDGKDLRTLVTEAGPFAPRKALCIARCIAEALAYAHHRGLVHRDIKPANIMLTSNGDAKLVDFGLARLAEESHEVTVTGQIIGTPLYMSPEQCRGSPLDARTDLYSLGATLYFMLTGKVPFAGKTTLALISRITNEAPIPIASLVPTMPPRVTALVQRLMAKSPSARLRDGQELVQTIDEMQRERIVFAWEAPQRPNQQGPSLFSWSKAAALIVVAALVAAMVYFQKPGDAEAPSREASAPAAVHAHDEAESAPTPPEPAPAPPESVPAPPESAPTTPNPPNQTVESDPRQEAYEALENHLPDIIEDLAAGRTVRSYALIDPGEPHVKRAIDEIAKRLAASRPGSARHRTVPNGPAGAQSFVTFIQRGGGPIMNLVIDWNVHDERWCIRNVHEAPLE
jgi:eukaryotic-like serine/threonine-protein kinase